MAGFRVPFWLHYQVSVSFFVCFLTYWQGGIVLPFRYFQTPCVLRAAIRDYARTYLCPALGCDNGSRTGQQFGTARLFLKKTTGFGQEWICEFRSDDCGGCFRVGNWPQRRFVWLWICFEHCQHQLWRHLVCVDDCYGGALCVLDVCRVLLHQL